MLVATALQPSQQLVWIIAENRDLSSNICKGEIDSLCSVPRMAVGRPLCDEDVTRREGPPGGGEVVQCSHRFPKRSFSRRDSHAHGNFGGNASRRSPKVVYRPRRGASRDQRGSGGWGGGGGTTFACPREPEQESAGAPPPPAALGVQVGLACHLGLRLHMYWSCSPRSPSKLYFVFL